MTASRSLWSVVLLSATLGGCGTDTANGYPAVQSGGGSGGGGGSSAGGQSAGTAGSPVGGAGAMTGCPAGLQEFGADSVDLALGGVNADLPAPSIDCLTNPRESYFCFALSGIVNGVEREILCSTWEGSETSGTSMGCSTAAGEDVSIDTRGYGGMTPPATFTYAQTEQMFTSPLRFTIDGHDFYSGDTNFVEVRFAGWVNKFQDFGRCVTTTWGVVAGSWSDAGSGETRVRGSFHLRGT